MNYFSLLRALFRSIGVGKFELLYKEFLPLLPVLLETFNRLLAIAYKPQMKELFVELCLTVPVRLSALLPHLQHLMKPLVYALQVFPLSLSHPSFSPSSFFLSLFFWTRFFFPVGSRSGHPGTQDSRTVHWQPYSCLSWSYPCTGHQRPDASFVESPFPSFPPSFFLSGNWIALIPKQHLRQGAGPTNHGITTLKILGKLGGRNRRMLKDPRVLSLNPYTERSLSVKVSFEGSDPISLPIDSILEQAKSVLETSSDHVLRKQAFQALKWWLIFVSFSFFLFFYVSVCFVFDKKYFFFLFLFFIQFGLCLSSLLIDLIWSCLPLLMDLEPGTEGLSLGKTKETQPPPAPPSSQQKVEEASTNSEDKGSSSQQKDESKMDVDQRPSSSPSPSPSSSTLTSNPQPQASLSFTEKLLVKFSENYDFLRSPFGFKWFFFNLFLFLFFFFSFPLFFVPFLP